MNAPQRISSIRAGVIGAGFIGPVHIEALRRLGVAIAAIFQDWLFKDTDYNWRLLPGEGGRLRAVADIGTHWMDTVSFILGARIKTVFADLATFHKIRKRPLGEAQTFTQTRANVKYDTFAVRTEDFASVLLQFDNGARGALSVSQVAVCEAIMQSHRAGKWMKV